MKNLIIGAATLACVLLGSHRSHAGIDCYRHSGGSCVEGRPHALPNSVAEFLALREKIGRTPKGGATLFVHALNVYLHNEALGMKLLTIALAPKNLIKGGTYKGFTPRSWDRRKLPLIKHYAYCVRGYSAGATPANGYKLDRKAITVRFRTQSSYVGSIKSGRYRIFVCNTGTDSCRPTTLLRTSRGFWKTTEWSSYAMGCRRPVKKPTADPL